MLTYETGSTKVGKTDSWQCNSPLCSSRSNIGTDRPEWSKGPSVREDDVPGQNRGVLLHPDCGERQKLRTDGCACEFTLPGTCSGRETEIWQRGRSLPCKNGLLFALKKEQNTQKTTPPPTTKTPQQNKKQNKKQG